MDSENITCSDLARALGGCSVQAYERNRASFLKDFFRSENLSKLDLSRQRLLDHLLRNENDGKALGALSHILEIREYSSFVDCLLQKEDFPIKAAEDLSYFSDKMQLLIGLRLINYSSDIQFALAQNLPSCSEKRQTLIGWRLIGEAKNGNVLLNLAYNLPRFKGHAQTVIGIGLAYLGQKDVTETLKKSLLKCCPEALEIVSSVFELAKHPLSLPKISLTSSPRNRYAIQGLRI